MNYRIFYGRFFSETLEVLNPGIKSVKNIWNLKRV